MSQFRVLPSDPSKRKAWAAKVATDSFHEQYFSRLIGAEGTNAAIVRKTDLETSGAGDEVVTTLVAKIIGTPKIYGEKLAGSEAKFSTTAHTMRINEVRYGVNIGARIDQTRVGYNIKKQGREKLIGHLKEVYEQIVAMHLSGARGTGAELSHFPTTWAGYPNDFRAPDAGHLFVGDGTKAKGTMLATEKMSLAVINKLRTKARVMRGGQPENAVRIERTSAGGKECYILAVCPEVMEDVRNDAGDAGWINLQKSLVTSVGKEAEVFKGGAGMFNGVLIDECEVSVKFSDYGVSSNIPAARSLFLGANAGVVAHGTRGMADGMEVSLREDTDDRGHDAVLTYEIIFGADKTAFNSMDFGMLTVDTAFTASV